MATDKPPALAAHTDSYFLKTKAIVGRFGDRPATYAVFMRRPVISTPRLAIDFLESEASERGTSFEIELNLPEGALVGAGELYASMPAYPERVKELQDKRAPVAWYCPDLVPLSFSSVAIFRNSPGTFGGRIFVNWLLSKEGQLSQLAVFGTPPVHKELQSQDFHIFPDEIRGKELISFDDQAQTEKFLALWKKYALTGSRR